MADYWQELGIRIPDLVAGFAGGVVNAFVFKRSSPVAIVGSVIVGAFTANYLGLSVSDYLHVSSGAASFLVGVAGMAFVQGAIEGAGRWQPFKGGNNGNPP